MLFNSLEYLLFLPIVFSAYWILNRWTSTHEGLRLQNLLVLAASYVFYGWWDWRFLSLIALSTVVDYVIGQRIANANALELDQNAPAQARSKRAKMWLFVSLGVNLGLLGYFKYANFFIESWANAWAAAGVSMHYSSLQIILPVGISFYTFQTLSYSLDIYRRRIEPSRDFIAFASFVSFFPQLVAGPIERASALLPQISKRRHFDHDFAVSGMRLILWGMFKKVVVADTCAFFVNDIFANYEQYSGLTLVMGAIYFAFQIYGDFSGYSDIAIGTARLFGIHLMTNFKTPYFSRDIAEFWRRWHISLSTWFRDYLYIPLGGSRVGKWSVIRNTFTIFLVSGLWHGANWTFVVWGFIHACLFLPLLLLGRNRQNTNDIEGWPSLREIGGMGYTFAAVTVAWVFFRAENISDAFLYLERALTFSSGNSPSSRMFVASLSILFTVGVDFWIARATLRQKFYLAAPWVRQMTYLVAVLIILLSWSDKSTQFIYFQF